ncbi:MAG: DUF342 domain-containing protein [Lachnospira sp.]
MVKNFEDDEVFDFLQQEEIRKGKEKNLDISIYAKPEIPFNEMRQLRKGLEKGYDLSEYVHLGVGVLAEVRKSLEAGVPLSHYINVGYDSEQLVAIRHALEKNIDIQPYLNIAYHGSCITEIAIGLEHNIDVTPYADVRYTWRKMREIRLGIEKRLDISKYLSPLYSYWQMREIRLGLEEGLDVDCYRNLMYTAKEMHKRRICLKNHDNIEFVTGNWTIIRDNEYDIKISPDGLKAYFIWHSNNPVGSVEEIQKILIQNGIVYGVNITSLEEIADKYGEINIKTDEEREILVATGIEAVNGNNGYYEWFFETEVNYLPQLTSDGIHQFDNISWFQPVEEGQILAVYHNASPAYNGKTVTGKIIRAKKGKEKSMLKGRGFKILPDMQTYVAERSGHVRLNNNELMVSDLIVLEDVAPSLPVVSFDSDVYIKGIISKSVKLNVKGNLQIDSAVEGIQINCTGNLLLKSGINSYSNPCPVIVHGYIVSKYFEYVNIQADGNIYFGNSLNSNLSSYGEIIGYGDKGGIIGGTSYAEKGFCIPNLGNSAGISTTLMIGDNSNIRQKRRDMETQALEIRSTIARLTEAYNSFRKNYTAVERNSNPLFLKTEDAIYTENLELEVIDRKLLTLRKRYERACNSKIIVEQQIYDNVFIQYMEQKISAIPYKNVEIYVKNNKIVIERFHRCGVKPA